MPLAYKLMLELGLSQWTSVLASLLLLFDNAMLTQSRFILMESMLIMFDLFGLLCILKFRKKQAYSLSWWFYLIVGFVSLTCALCVKYSGFCCFFLAVTVLTKMFWSSLSLPHYSDFSLVLRFMAQALVIVFVPVVVYVGIFYVHLNVLYKAGPHDSVMTSAFQASLEGGLASITRGQPLMVAHGSQVTLRYVS